MGVDCLRYSQYDDRALAVACGTGRVRPPAADTDTQGRSGATETGGQPAQDPLARLLKWCQGLLVVVAIVALAYCVFVLADESLYQNQETERPLSNPDRAALVFQPRNPPALY